MKRRAEGGLETEVYDYPRQLYIYTINLGMSTESYIVEKMGNNQIRRQGDDTIFPISPQEYDLLRPIRVEAIERRDELLKKSLDIVAASSGGTSILDTSDLGLLAETNRVVLQGLLGDNGALGNIRFIRSREAKLQFIGAIENNDALTFQMFMRTREFEFGNDQMPGNLNVYRTAIEMCTRYNRSHMLRSILRRWNLLNDLTLPFMRRCAQYVCENRNYNILQVLAKYSQPFHSVNEFKGVLYTAACRMYWKDGIRLLGKYDDTTLLADNHQERNSNMYYLINGGDLSLIREVLDRRPRENVERILVEGHPTHDTPVMEALKIGRYDMVDYFLSKSRPGFSVCGNELLEQSGTIITAIRYRDALENVFYAPLDIFRRIIIDVRSVELAMGAGTLSVVLSEFGYDGIGPLVACCERDDALECARILLDNGAKVYGHDGENRPKTTPLIEASRRGNLPLVRLLLERGASPIQASKIYQSYFNDDELLLVKILETPLFVAAFNNHREVFDLLLGLQEPENRANGPLVKIKYDGESRKTDFLTAIMMCEPLSNTVDDDMNDIILNHLITTHGFGINYAQWESNYDIDPDLPNFFDEILNLLGWLDEELYNIQLLKGYFTTVYLKLSRDQQDVIMPTLLHNRLFEDVFQPKEYDFLLSLPNASIEDIPLRQSILDYDPRQLTYFLRKGANPNKEIIVHPEGGGAVFRGTALQLALRERAILSDKIREEVGDREVVSGRLERINEIIQILQPQAAGGAP